MRFYQCLQYDIVSSNHRNITVGVCRITNAMSVEMSLEKKFTFLLAKKLKGGDVKPEMDTLSKEELILFKKWIAKKKEGAEEKIWKKKQAQRSKGQ